jgi:hypothetical protein
LTPEVGKKKEQKKAPALPLTFPLPHDLLVFFFFFSTPSPTSGNPAFCLMISEQREASTLPRSLGSHALSLVPVPWERSIVKRDFVATSWLKVSLALGKTPSSTVVGQARPLHDDIIADAMRRRDNFPVWTSKVSDTRPFFPRGDPPCV